MTTRPHPLLLLLPLLLIAALPSPARGQEAEPEAEPPAQIEAEALTASEQAVDVRGASDDSAIAARIRSILIATGAFDEPIVEVQDGVVFLRGTAESEAYVEWASALAQRTEDVVAVVDDLQVVEAPMWDLSPAVAELESLGREAVRGLPLLVLGLAVLAITLALSRGVSRLLVRLLAGRMDSTILKSVLEKTIYVGVLLFGIYVFLRISGLTRVAVTLVGGTGIAGLVLGFAFRDIAENFLSSLLISLQRPFKIGDTITVADHTGVVERVTTRGTVLMDFDGNHIQIANATVYKSTIINLTANPKMRISFLVGIGYDSPISEAQAILHGVMEAHSAVIEEPAPRVLVEELGASTVNLRLFAWIDGHEHSKTRVESSLMRQALRALMKAGVSMPDESREVVFPNGVPIMHLDGRVPDGQGSGRAADSSEVELTLVGGGSGGEPHKPSRPLTRAEQAEPEDETTEAEGDLSSESAEIKEQARASGSPESSADVLI